MFEKCLQNLNLSFIYPAKSESEVIISGDSAVPGLGGANNNIIPLITNLQASLKAPPGWRQDPEGSAQPGQTAEETNNSLVKTTQPTCDNFRQQVTDLTEELSSSILTS